MEPRDREGEAARGSVRQAGPRAVTTDFDPRTLIPVFSCPAARYIPPPIRVTAPRQPFKPRHLRLFRSACRPVPAATSKSMNISRPGMMALTSALELLASYTAAGAYRGSGRAPHRPRERVRQQETERVRLRTGCDQLRRESTQCG